MDSPMVQPLLGCWIQLEAPHDSGPASAFQISLFDLCDPSSSGVGRINAQQVTEDVVMLWISGLEVAVQGFGCLLAAGDEARFVRVDS